MLDKLDLPSFIVEPELRHKMDFFLFELELNWTSEVNHLLVLGGLVLGSLVALRMGTDFLAVEFV